MPESGQAHRTHLKPSEPSTPTNQKPNTRKQAWKPGQSGNPGGRPGNSISARHKSDFHTQPFESQIKALRQDASVIAHVLGKKVLSRALQINKKDSASLIDLQRLAMSWGISYDKVVTGADAGDLILKIPAPLIEAFQVLITAKTVDKSVKKPVDILKTDEVAKIVDSSTSYERA